MGIMTVDEGITAAIASGLDLVEVGQDKDIPTCRIMNYGKFRYERHKKDKDAKKKQKIVLIKEIKLRPKIDKHDYETKMRHIREFIEFGHKVRLTIMFRGREMDHVEIGANLLERAIQDLNGIAVLESRSSMQDNNLAVLLAPKLVKEEKNAKVKDQQVSSEKV